MSKKISNLIAAVLMIIGAILGIYTFIRCGQLDAVVPAEKAEMVALINPIFYWSYTLVIIAVLALIIVPIPYILQNPGTMKKFGLGIVALGVVILLAYMFSSDAGLPFNEGAETKNAFSRLADLNIISVYIMSLVAILSIIVSSVMTAVRLSKK